MFRVMIVDDMDITRKELKRLKLWGAETGFFICSEAKNGHEALEILQKTNIDLVLTDVKMPKVDGFELLKKIKEGKLCPCVVLLSDYSDYYNVRQGLVSGAFDYLTKPIDTVELRKLLIRAKEDIINKRSEEERTRNIEHSINEKIEFFSTEAESRAIIELIQEDSANNLEKIMAIVDNIGMVMGNDPIKIEHIFKNMLLDISNDVLMRYVWLEKFVDTKEVINVDFSKYKEFNEIKEVFVNVLEKIVFRLNELQCGSSKNSIVNQVCNYVLVNIDSEISLKHIAEILYMNKSYISEVFKEKTGVLFSEYTTKIKIERAKKLIIEGQLKAYEISEKLGFKDAEYFGRLFKKYTGVTLAKYRQIINN